MPTIVTIEPFAEGRIVGAPVLLIDAADAAADGDNVGTLLIRIGEGIVDSPLVISVADGDNVFTSTRTIGKSFVFKVVTDDDGFGTWIGWRVLALRCLVVVVVSDGAPVARVVGEGALVAEIVGDGELVSSKAKRLGLIA